ncbi:hypothetical protein BJ875DRAFT_249652 [Amylocarpus encephaloides]|uniref:SWIM-type domain-containing protein n=1 Tax=Amylocarpus encephaloides TaxID=45428 RepID=A0A9P7YM05_9HELO|nr:hypothetical protein BJ875DRAFT_249652 [Amylocarpus encephaloides]
MSPPSLQFSQLSIASKAKMQKSGPSQQSPSKGKGKARALPEETPTSSDEDSEEDESSDEDRGDSEDGSEDEDDMEGNVDLSWNGRMFALDHCRQHGPVYAFQIAYAKVQRYGVRISTNESGRPVCTCSEQGMCRHVRWLLDQLSRADGRGVQPSGVSPYEHITTLGLGNVCHRLHWELRESPDSEETEYHLSRKGASAGSHRLRQDPSRQTRAMIRDRVDAVCDMLATLSPDKFAHEFRRRIFGVSDNITINNVLAPRDLETTLARILVLNDNMFQQFQTFVPDDARASEYFRKMAEKAQYTCLLLDKYCEFGPDPSGTHHDLIWCAQTLVDIVGEIHQNITERQPLSSASREEAARALIDILRTVVKRNREVYLNLTWPRRRKHGEPQVDRNLYMRLIGVDNKDNPARGTFVVNALQDLPEAQRYVEDLEEISARLDEIAWKAPQPYKIKLHAVISQLKKDRPPTAATSSGKRAASSLEPPGSKRMMK